MKKYLSSCVLCILIAISPSSSFGGSTEDAANNAIAWLQSMQNTDGSWGDQDSVKLLQTSESVLALKSFYQLSSYYYWGITWLENHNSSNTDYKARKISALLLHGDNIDALKSDIIDSQTLSGDSQAGWGLSSSYFYSPLDTAITMNLLQKTNWPDYVEVLSFLKGSQNTDFGWSLSEDGTSDALTTAIVIQALCLYQSVDGELTAVIQNAESYLESQVSTGSLPIIKAQTILALLPNNRYPAKISGLIDSLLADQNVNGHWDSDVYTTALVVRTLSAYLNYDLEGKEQLCTLTDENLRAVINYSMGKNSADSLSSGEMESLDSLDASGAGIENLTGIDCAANLTTLDLSNNNITDIDVLVNLSPDSQIILTGNPLSDQRDADGDGISDLAEVQAGSDPLNSDSIPQQATPVPAVQWYGLLVLIILLIFMGKTNLINKRRIMYKSTQCIWLICCLFLLLPSQIKAEDALTSKEQKEFRNLSKTILVSNLAEKRSVEKQTREKRKIVNQARRSLKKMERGLRLYSVEISGETDSSVYSESSTITLSQDNEPVHLNPDLVNEQGVIEVSKPSEKKRQSNNAAENKTVQQSYKKSVTTREARKKKINELLDTSISEIARYRGELETLALVKSKTSKKTNLFPKKSDPALLIIQEVETELQAMKQTGPTLIKIKTLSERLTITKNQNSSKKPSPTFSTLIKHRK